MISVIVPIYNAEKYLRECIESILAQTYTDWELILVDDGSTDSSGSIADSYASTDPRIRVLHIENGGVAMARNIGILNSKGENITFIDSDDYIYKDALSRLKDIIRITDADIVIGGFDSGKKYRRTKYRHEKIKVLNPHESVEDLLFQKRIPSSPWAKLYKRHLFSIKFDNYKCYEDLDLIFRQLLMSKKIAYTDSPVYFYRSTKGSLINSWGVHRLDVLDVTERIEDYMTRNHPELVKAARDRRLSANFNIFALASQHDDREVADRCWSIVKQYRNESLFNPRVRLKNKGGILLSYLGKRVFALAGKIVYRD